MTIELEGDPIAQCLDVDVVRSTPVATSMRAAEEDSPLGTLVGEFTVFNEWYEINSMWEGHFIERTKPGAFRRTIKNRSDQSPVRVILEHGFDPTVGDKPLGVPRVLEERASGVYAETPLFDTSYNRDLAPALEGGAYGQSFRFRVRADQWSEPDSDGWEDTGNAAWADLPQRSITEVRLEEFGPTIWPASPATNASTGLRSTTDEFYDQLARRDSARYESAVRSVRGLRAPVTPASAGVSTTEDPHNGHSEDPTPAQVERGHSEDSPATHSTEPTSTESRKDNVMDNMTLEERAARIAEIEARLNDIDTANGVAELRSDDQTEWDAISTEKAEHEAAIRAYEARQSQLRTAAANKAATEDGDTTAQRATRYSAPSTIIKPENIYDTTAIRQRAGSLDEARKLYRDHAKRAVEVAQFPGVERSAAQEHVSDMLERLDDDESTLALRLLRTGSPLYDRAFGKAAIKGSIHALSPDEQRALSLGADASGGFAVPFQLDPTVILTSNGQINPLRSISRVVQITGKIWEGLTSAGITVTRGAEAAQTADVSPTLAQPTVATSRVDGFIPFSYELEYTWPQLRQEMTALLADAKDAEEVAAFVNGTGVAPQPQGVLVGATTLVSTASATALTRADLYKVKNALPPRWRARASWLADTSFYDQTRELSQNGDIVGDGLEGGGPASLLSKPAYEASSMPAFVGTTGAVDAVIGDFSQFVIVDRVGMSVELIPQVFGAAQRPTGQRGIYALWMNGSKVLVPGAFRVLKQA